MKGLLEFYSITRKVEIAFNDAKKHDNLKKKISSLKFGVKVNRNSKTL